MRDRVVTLTQLTDYLQCGLYYRFRHELGFPHRNGSPIDHALWQTCSRATARLFNALGAGQSRVKARNIAVDGRFIMYTWVHAGGATLEYPFAHAHARMLVLDTLELLGSTFKPIGGDIPVSKTVGEYLVEGLLEGAFVKTDIDRKKSLVVVQIDHDNQMMAGPRVKHLREALVKDTFSKASIGSPLPIKLLRIRIPSRKISWRDLDRRSYPEFNWLAKSVIHGIDNQHYTPTDVKRKCDLCCYKGICSNYFSVPGLSEQIISKCKGELEA